MADGVVVEAPRGDAEGFRQAALAHRKLIVKTLQERRDEAAEVWNNIGDMGEPRRDLLGDEVQRDHRVLHRGAHGAAKAVVGDHR